MIRLDFVLPEWTRVVWNSLNAQNVWESRINRISAAFSDIERKTVLQGIKPSCLTSMDPQELSELVMKLAGTDYAVVPLSKHNKSNSYQSSSFGYTPGVPFDYRVVITRNEMISEWKEVWAAGDDRKIGKLLGFPDCCINFFQKYWKEENMVDTSWAMSLSGTEGPKECNILLRWLGVRSVSHLPCSFNCHETYKLGRANIEFGKANGYEQEMEWLEEILDWPVQWNALHGIAEIKTPVLKISTRTDATADNVIVNRNGFSYPEEGTSGINFPYINRSKNILTKTGSFRKSLLLENQWLDNGFSSLEAMNHSHQILLTSLKSMGKPDGLKVIDFGCGNAELLKLLQGSLDKNIRAYGVEIDEQRYNRIKINFPEQTEQFWRANMFDSGPWLNQTYDVAIVMPGRLVEAGASNSQQFIQWLNTNVKNVLFYAYGDWVQRIEKDSGNFLQLLKDLGLSFVPQEVTKSEHCASYYGSLTSKSAEVPVLKVMN